VARDACRPLGATSPSSARDGQVFALRDSCPHKGGPLSQGIVHGHAVTCPLHGRVIDLATGEGTGADKGSGCALVAPLEVRQGRLLLGLVGA
jgi:nitrite reductase (NADH) small subunit